MDNKKLIRDFIRNNKLAVISTISPEGKTQSAVLEFGDTDALELIFDTFNTARKYFNLKQNKNVSFVIGWDENITVQYEGEATELEVQELEKYKQVYFKKNPEAQKWETQEEVKYFKVKPLWIRYSDLNKEPWEVIEIKP